MREVEICIFPVERNVVVPLIHLIAIEIRDEVNIRAVQVEQSVTFEYCGLRIT